MKRLLPKLLVASALAFGWGAAVAEMPMPPNPAEMMEAGKKAMETMRDAAYHGAKPALDKLPDYMNMVKPGDKFQFPPSYITVPGNRKLTEADFGDPSVCAGCHPRQYKGWKGSMHANALKDPIFQKLWHMGEVATGGKLLNHCGGCHTPIGVATGTLKHNKETGEFTAGPIGSQGVSCDVCHNISKTNFLETATLEHGNASFELDPRGMNGRKLGPLKDAMSPFHPTQYSELHTKADFCGNCHNIFNPANGFPVERTYDEWKYSIYARKDIVCQDCHMNPVETAIRVAKELKKPKDLEGENLGGFAGMGAPKQRDVVHEHGFVGGNAVVTALLTGEGSEHAAAARKRLQNAAELDLRFEKRMDGLQELRVEVTNVGAGHNLPTSLTDVREVWVHVVIKDDQGKVIYENGQLDSHGELNHDDVTIFNAVAVDENGKVTHLPWEVTRFIRETTIPPKGSSISRYAFAVPDGVKKVVADVKLNYRSYGQHLADVVLGAGTITIPVIEMEHEVAELDL